MMKILGLIFILIMPMAHAKDFIYPTPPSNDTSLYFNGHYTSHQHHHRSLPKAKTRPKAHHHMSTAKKHHHRTTCRLKRHGAGSLLVYYVLPATACCGETYVLRKANCCARSGAWQTSYYASFQPGAEDFIYSATNDDESRSYDMYRNVIADDTMRDPPWDP